MLAVPPFREGSEMRVKIVRYCLCLLGAITLTLIGGVIYLQIEIHQAVSQWAAVGGGVSVEYNPRLGPNRMFLGSMPGQETSGDLAAIRLAAVRLNSISGCKKLGIAGMDWSSSELRWLLSALTLEELSLRDMSIDPDCVNYIASRNDIQMLQTGRIFSAEDIRVILLAAPTRRMDVSADPLSPADQESLKTEFQDRIAIY